MNIYESEEYEIQEMDLTIDGNIYISFIPKKNLKEIIFFIVFQDKKNPENEIPIAINCSGENFKKNWIHTRKLITKMDNINNYEVYFVDVYQIKKILDKYKMIKGN